MRKVESAFMVSIFFLFQLHWVLRIHIQYLNFCPNKAIIAYWQSVTPNKFKILNIRNLNLHSYYLASVQMIFSHKSPETDGQQLTKWGNVNSPRVWSRLSETYKLKITLHHIKLWPSAGQRAKVIKQRVLLLHQKYHDMMLEYPLNANKNFLS